MDNLKEKCGIICNNTFYELKNISRTEYEFICDPSDFYTTVKGKCSDDIQAIVHTHEESCEPSYKDIMSMKIWNIPWIIISKKCIKSILYLNGSILELDIHSLLSQELYHSLMKLLQ
ncbi:hypothetical protein SULI_05530 [Saccharolobus solfataricus]|uniref:JAB domain-containing protein n=2 Tax=Saccharolobus solfataricus TaxID=2287 RepID=Q7LXY3_SACS2|nr:Hypothetical protein SSO0111 [Saccharolobus solfataricus P2]AYN75588.1 hypothetical protein SULB_03205 [Saccharolobus solfataricus]AYN75751.1 hypothetical protein SULC_03200 [Saccharolobus solfataricus]AYP18585.1 hypothetical protein SULA_03205 [Saccharolobus solfataricus]AZF67916.1 hypothetical protein SULG_05530 [Saccharolobus solfataricus]